MTEPKHKPCFEGNTESPYEPDECQESRYFDGSDPDCMFLKQKGNWKTCSSGKQHPWFSEWKYHCETIICSKCRGTGRVKK